MTDTRAVEALKKARDALQSANNSLLWGDREMRGRPPEHWRTSIGTVAAALSAIDDALVDLAQSSWRKARCDCNDHDVCRACLDRESKASREEASAEWLRNHAEMLITSIPATREEVERESVSDNDYEPLQKKVLQAMHALRAARKAQEQPARDDLIKALGDLSFECFAVFGTCAPSVETYNRTLDVLQKARSAPAPIAPAQNVRPRFQHDYNPGPPKSVRTVRTRYVSEKAEGDAPLLAALIEARDDIASWGAYASDYFQKKHDLAGTIKRYDEIIAQAREGQS